jgi:hypothetical protein
MLCLEVQKRRVQMLGQRGRAARWHAAVHGCTAVSLLYLNYVTATITAITITIITSTIIIVIVSIIPNSSGPAEAHQNKKQ